LTDSSGAERPRARIGRLEGEVHRHGTWTGRAVEVWSAGGGLGDRRTYGVRAGAVAYNGRALATANGLVIAADWLTSTTTPSGGVWATVVRTP
jgi:hypothetical protein